MAPMPTNDHPQPPTPVLTQGSLIVRAGLHRLLAGADDVEIVTSCAGHREIMGAIDERGPEVVVTDIRMPPATPEDVVELAAWLREAHPDVGLVVLSNHADPAFALALLESGAAGRAYLLEERVHDRAELLAAIRTVAAGGSMIDPAILAPLLAARGTEGRNPLVDLTPREREVLGELAKGKSNAAIADALLLSKRAVEKHINSIFLKLDLADATDVSKRVAAALLYRESRDVRAGARG